MKHNISISVSKTPQPGGVIACRTLTMRERILRLLFGQPCKMTILVPGDTVEEVAIQEIPTGGVVSEAV